ncbi:MAG: hypothetical protein JHC87_04960 [Thermoleophilaceae bacterium]|nr:hypothetical protein [Thermoleophilaceae bacterium]
MALLRAELRRQLGRRGSAWGSAGLMALVGGGIVLWALLSKNATAAGVVDNGGGTLAFFAFLVAVLIGALAGSFDVDQGTMRYLVLTGVSRTRLALVRLPGIAITLLVVMVPAYLLVFVAVLIAGGEAPTGEMWLDLFYQPILMAWIYGTISLAIGMMLRSNGVAIAVAMLINFAGLLLAELIADKVSVLAGELFISSSTAIVMDRTAGHELSIAAAVFVTIAWMVVLMGAAVARVQRAEY